MSSQAIQASLDYIQERISASMPPKMVGEKLTKAFSEEANRTVLEEFIREPEVQTVYIYPDGAEKLVVTLQPQIKKKGVFMLKNHKIQDVLKVEEIKHEVIISEITEDALQDLSLVAQEVYFPLLSNPSNRAGWSGPTSKDVMLKFSHFLSNVTMAVGQARGQTLLPHPPPEAFDEYNLVEKERVHLLESSVLTWTNKIQAVLATDPEQTLRAGAQAAAAFLADKKRAANAALLGAGGHGGAGASAAGGAAAGGAAAGGAAAGGAAAGAAAGGASAGAAAAAAAGGGEKEDGAESELAHFFPGPYFELEFWQNKANDLASLQRQLQGEKLQQVLQILTNVQSPFAAQLSRLTQDVSEALKEAKENNRYLKTLKPYFTVVTEELDFPRIEESFVPMLHTMLLVFKHSHTYNTKARLSCLVQEICNALVLQAQKHISGETIFRLIEDENTSEAVHLVKLTMTVLENFKKLFGAYQDKARAELTSGAWDVPTDVLFARLESFLERGTDILEFTKIVLEFSKLEKIFLGGTKGKDLTQSLRQVHADFVKSVEKFKSVDYDIMDVSVTTFDDDFYTYRCEVKELERRLSAILMASFDEATTLSVRFKLLDTFEGLLDRPIIADELDKKQSALLSMYMDDLKVVQEQFHRFKAEPRVETNLPPIAGALSWCRALHDRATEPLERFKFYTGGDEGERSEREEVKEIERVQLSIVQQLKEYEQRMMEQWASEIDQTSEEKLQQPLLRRDAQSRLLFVNFDSALVRLLREVKYFLLLRLPVPATALNVYQKAEQYRAQIGNLELIVSMYNEMMSTLHPVERPLVEKDLVAIDEKVERGISSLSWKSEAVDAFIAECMEIVKQVYGMVKVMKDNLSALKKIMSEYASVPLIDRKNKPLSPADFEENLRKLWQQRHAVIAEHQESVTKLLKETSTALKAQESSVMWRAYVEYVQDHVRDGLALTIQNSIKFLCEQLDPSNMEKSGLAPLLEIKLGLVGNDVQFNAEETANAGAGAGAGGAGHSSHASMSALSSPSNAAAAAAAAAASGGGGGSSGVSAFSGFGNLQLGLDGTVIARKSRRDVWQIINDWVEGFFDICAIMTRADGTTYVSEAKKNDGIVRSSAVLKKWLDSNAKQCEDLRAEYTKYEFLWKTDRQVEFHRFLNAAIAESKSKEEKKDGNELASPMSKPQTPSTNDGGEGGEEHDEEGEAFVDVLPLDRFEERILYYKEIANEIAEKKTPVDVAWLKINAQPIKLALQTWVGKWIHTFTAYLYNDVTRKLNALEALMKEVNAGLQVEVQAGDSATLKKVLGYIHAVRSKEKSTLKMFQPLRDTVQLLKKYGKNLDEYELKLLSDAPMKWDSTVNNVYKVKEKVNTLQNDEVDKIKEKVMQFEGELKMFRKNYKDHAPFQYDVDQNDAYDLLFEYHKKINVMEERALKLTDLEKVFELTVSKHRQIKKCRTENRLLKQVWDMVSLVQHQFEDWRKTPWDRIDTDALLGETKKLQRQLVGMPPEVQSWDVYMGLQTEVKNLLTVLPLVNLLHSPAMEDRHWRELKIATGKQFNKDESFCLSNLLELELHKFVPDVEYIVELANKESKISQQLKKIESQWAVLELQFGTAKSGIAMIKRPDEVLVTLEENMAALQGMQGQGKYVEHFIEEVTKWQKLLNQAESVLYDWLDVQAKWSSLESIFLGSKDIRVQLPEDSKRFDSIDAEWKQMMSSASQTPNVIEACSTNQRGERLTAMKRGLELCEKSLFQYLETKRMTFPRFYFLSNAALLDILSSGHDPQSVQKHLGDCFDNIAKLSFHKDSEGVPTKTATGMFSKEGEEYVSMFADFDCVGPVEDWLNGLVEAMRLTLREILSKAKFTADHWEIEKPRHKWLFDYPAQLALTASQMVWTEEVNSQFDAFADGNEQAMKEYSKVLALRLENLIQLVLGDLTLCDRIKIMTLITVDVHNRDVVQKLIDTKTQEASAFAWQSQMRMKWKADTKDCVIMVADASFLYVYEYVGNTGRLVITPLTDRCYITLTQALRLIMGGAPAGPAGTGKTETTKDLGRALGIAVYVFNCSEQMNVQSLGSIFKGLSQTGAWGCFDEFNRIPIEVLSVVSTQVGCILNAIREKRSEFDFMGEIIKLIPSVGMFITMNPGYAGRTELPENLKALFRSCAMCVPDMDLICENMLMSEGFLQAHRLAKKFTTLYSLSKELLSKQRHYDWGLRATKAVLRVAGGLKRAEPKVDEDRILMRALRDFNLPKLVDDDKPIFRELIGDLFPGMANTERKFDPKLQEAIAQVAVKRGLQAEEVFVMKCVELAELMAIRHSVFVIGPAGCGKTEIWKTLMGALRHMGKKAAYEVINPKAVRNDELYGFLKKTDWQDGLLSSIMRNMSRCRPPYTEDQTSKWCVLDGDIDPNWIESLNCFPADDHEVLTASGFMSLDAVQAHFAQHETLDVACYVDGQLQYRPITVDKLTVKTGDHMLVEMVGGDAKAASAMSAAASAAMSSAAGVSLTPTANHRMYAALRLAASASSSSAPASYEIVRAGDMLAAGRADPSMVAQMCANAPRGVATSDKDALRLPFVRALGLRDAAQVAAFLTLYGYWLIHGSLVSADRAIAFERVQAQDRPIVEGLLQAAGLVSVHAQDGEGFYRRAAAAADEASACAYMVNSRAWWNLFARQYGHKYSGYWAEVAALEGALMGGVGVPQGVDRVAVAAKDVEKRLVELLLATPRESDASAPTMASVSTAIASLRRSGAAAAASSKSALPDVAAGAATTQWLFDWVMFRLGASNLRDIVRGLTLASSSSSSVRTSSARLRDELEQMLLHAGYSTHFELEPTGRTGASTSPVFRITFSDQTEIAEPRLHVASQCKARPFSGTVWCVTVPTQQQLIVFRRVLSRSDDAPRTVLEASRPIVVGNTVMDDNKMLTLVSNERIPLTPSMRMVFEIGNLDNATPATVSRAGILFINAKDVGSKPFLDSWIEKRENDKEKSSLLALFNKYCTPEYLHEMQTAFSRIIPVSEISMIRTLCYLLEGLLMRLGDLKKQRQRSEERVDPAVEKEVFEANFVFACVWAFGGAALVDKNSDSRATFSELFKRLFTTIKFPKEGTVFDYFPDLKTGKMLPWTDLIPEFKAPDDAYLVTKVFVPTVDTVSMQFVVDLLVQRGRPVLLVGTAGTGKTVLINHYLHSMGENMLYCNINLNYYTDAKALQLIMEGPIDKRSGRIFGPPTSKKLVYFIDDLNMPAVDQYGTQSPSCLIKQHMDYGAWYDVTKLERKEIQDVQYIACMNPTAGSFTIDVRLQSLFSAFAFLLPSKKILTYIYSSVLNHHFHGFSVPIQELVAKVIKASIELHDNVALKFIPSTRKFHYQFNLRDLSNIFQGLCLAQSGEGYTSRMIVQLWQHECTRVFSDRLVSPDDEAIFDEMIQAKLKTEFKDFLPKDDEKKKAGEEEPLVFTSFMAGGTPIYMPVDKMDALKSVLEQKLSGYNDSNPIMNLELFGIAMQHVCRIVRIIENPRGNALLVGVGGSGKQSLAKLASFICGYDVFQISVSQSYGMNDLKVDLQGLYMKAGVKNLPITWLLTDTQIVDDRWLVYVNDLLSTGNIPALFAAEDKDNILNAVRNEAKAQGVEDSRDALYEFFINQVRTNLHVVLCFSPVGELFRIRCRKFPALINCTTIDWFHPWPRDALVSVANRFLQDLDCGSDAVRAAVAEHMAEVHLSVNVSSALYQQMERRYNYTTPKSFLELIAFYKALLGKKRADLQTQTSRLEKGIKTLKQTHAQVAELKEDLQVTLVKVGEKAEAASVLIGKMGVERKKVEEQQALASIEADKAKAVSEVADRISRECKADLDKALPVLERAKNAVNCLTKASLTTLKSFASPPGNVLYVTNAVLIMKKVPGKRDWGAAKKMMKDVSKFLDELKSFDATQIDEDVLTKLQPILSESFFTEENMKSASEAAANLCSWVVNCVEYNAVYKNVAPKMAAQERANAEFTEAQAKLKVVEDKVAAMQAKLRTVTESLTEATDEKNKVEAEAANCQLRLGLAKRLVDGLADENERWSKSIENFRERGRTLVGDSMLAAAFVSYIGAFNQKFRLGLWKEQWIPDLVNRQIPLTPGVDPLHVLASDSDFAKWKNEGLAADRISLENGAIITQCSRWPLMIDPQLQGIKWIKGRVKNLKIIQLSQKRWMQAIVQAVQMGEVVLIEGVGEEFDASLDPVLSRSVFQRGSMKMIKLGSEEVVYDDGFHLYLQTKLFNPHYKPEIAAQCTLINFIVTEEGLEEQLLALVVNREKPELEEKRTALVRAINDYMVSLTDLENELLERLSNAPEDILSDVALIEGLEKTKLASAEIEQKVEQAKKQEISINAARNEFRMVAAESSWLYFLLIQLCTIDHMYQYSLDAFIAFFFKAMLKAKKSDVIKERVVNLRESIRITVFTWVTRGLFEKHKLIFSSQLCFKLMQKGALTEQFDAVLYDYLIRGPKKSGVEKTIQLDWLPYAAWSGIQKLIEIEAFNKLASDMQASPNRFKEWYNKARPEDTPLPLEWRKLDDTNPFMKLLVVRAMRPDRMCIAMENYVRNCLPNGKDFTECDAGKSFLDVLTLTMEDATPVNPVFFILSAGADPVSSVELIAKRAGFYEGKFHRVALGEGQDVVAMNRLELGHKEGHWVVLENIHLMPSWNGELEKKLDDFAAEGSHPDFRIFLSAEPSVGIPIGLLERSIKLTNEPPQGLKQNLKRAFASFEKEEFEFKDPKVKSIIFGLCHFHSVIMERIKFGPKGWNKGYPFNTGDLMCSSVVLTNYLESGNSGDKVPWSDLRYIFGEILYGGHITDDWDRLLCSTYLDFYMREELLDEMEMYPFNENFPEERFRSPPVLPYDQYFEYIDHELRPENPVAFGLHPNAEIAVKTKQATELFRAILDLQPRSGGGGGGDSMQSPQALVQMLIQTILTDKSKGIEGINFNLDDIASAVVDERGPYQNVFLQECDRMNILCREIRRSLKELDLGLSGELQMSERMEVLFQAMYLGRVPDSWTRLAYPSQRSLSSWMDNLILRAAQLQSWTEDPINIPVVVQISYLFNPQSFLTAIMQKTAQKQKMELDKLVIQTDVTRKTVEQTDTRARDGAYVYGLFMEGARWNWNSGVIEECLPREMSCPLPVVVCRAVLVDKLEKSGVYRCPCYKTQRRGDTYVFTANLRTKAPAAKWVLAGTVLVMEVDE